MNDQKGRAARPGFWWALGAIFLVAGVVGDYRHPSALPDGGVGGAVVGVIGGTMAMAVVILLPFAILYAVVRVIRRAWDAADPAPRGKP